MFIAAATVSCAFHTAKSAASISSSPSAFPRANVAAAPVLSGFGAALLWFALFGGLAHDLAAYAWWTIVAAITAWAMAIVLTVLCDRGAAVGIALASGLGLSIAVAFVGARWIATYDWPLW